MIYRNASVAFIGGAQSGNPSVGKEICLIDDFTPDAACTRCYLRNFTGKFFHDMFSCEGYLTKGCNGHINRCFPASTVVTPAPEGTTALGFYSPGMSCPAAWRAWTAFTFGVSVTNEWAHIAELMRSDETALVCCPE